MKTVTIPTCANPFVVIVNGIKYTYPAGATVEVPDDVAAVIEQHDEAHSKHAPAPVVPPFAHGPSEESAGGGGLPVVELTTQPKHASEGHAPLTAEESAALDAVVSKGMPFVLKFSTEKAASASFANITKPIGADGVVVIDSIVLDAIYMLTKTEGAWSFMWDVI